MLTKMGLGAALSGTILASRMQSLLPPTLSSAFLMHGGLGEIANLPAGQHALVLAAFFLGGAAVATLAFAVALFTGPSTPGRPSSRYRQSSMI